MLELKNVCKSYGGKQVLQDFCVRFPDSGTFALMGPSGCGKTTLLRLIAGLENPDSGEIILTRPAKISMVFQEDRLLGSLDVRSNILTVLSKSDSDLRLADECLARSGLLDVDHSRPAELSGGMRRRVAIARAMAFGGDILLLDEPFKGLDDKTKRMMTDFVFENSQNRLTVLVTHDKDEARELSVKILNFTGIPLALLD